VSECVSYCSKRSQCCAPTSLVACWRQRWCGVFLSRIHYWSFWIAVEIILNLETAFLTCSCTIHRHRQSFAELQSSRPLVASYSESDWFALIWLKSLPQLPCYSILTTEWSSDCTRCLQKGVNWTHRLKTYACLIDEGWIWFASCPWTFSNALPSRSGTAETCRFCFGANRIALNLCRRRFGSLDPRRLLGSQCWCS